jgi:hypothetical protein
VEKSFELVVLFKGGDKSFDTLCSLRMTASHLGVQIAPRWNRSEKPQVSRESFLEALALPAGDLSYSKHS